MIIVERNRYGKVNTAITVLLFCCLYLTSHTSCRQENGAAINSKSEEQFMYMDFDFYSFSGTVASGDVTPHVLVKPLSHMASTVSLVHDYGRVEWDCEKKNGINYCTRSTIEDGHIYNHYLRPSSESLTELTFVLQDGEEYLTCIQVHHSASIKRYYFSRFDRITYEKAESILSFDPLPLCQFVEQVNFYVNDKYINVVMELSDASDGHLLTTSTKCYSIAHLTAFWWHQEEILIDSVPADECS